MLIAVDGMNLTRLGSKEDTAFRSICRKALVALREKQTDLVLSLVAGGNLICFGRQAINAIVAWQ